MNAPLQNVYIFHFFDRIVTSYKVFSIDPDLAFGYI